MDAGFRFGLIVFLGGIWYFLLNAIKDVTANDAAHPALLFLAVLHFIVLVYLCLTLYSFFVIGVSLIGPTKVEVPGAQMIDAFVFTSWPAVVLASSLTYLVACLGLGDTIGATVHAFCYTVLATTAALYFFLFRGTALAQRPFQLWWVTPVVLVGLYLMGSLAAAAVSPFMADVQISTDKGFYQPNEPITVSVKTKGYVFLPNVSNIYCGKFNAKRRGTYLITPEMRADSNYIMVEFVPQVIPLTLVRSYELQVAKSD